MLKLATSLALALPLVLAACVKSEGARVGKAEDWQTQEASEQVAATETPTDTRKVVEFYAVIKKIDGPVEEIIIETPDGDFPEAQVGMQLPSGSVIMTGQVQVVLTLEGVYDSGEPFVERYLSVRHTSELKLDRMLVDPDESSFVTRMKIKTGEVRATICDDRPDYSHDFKVATPNATASVRSGDVAKIGYSSTKARECVVAGGLIKPKSDTDFTDEPASSVTTPDAGTSVR